MNKSSEMGLVSSSDLIDAKLEEHHLCGSKQCPGCGQKLQGKPDWLGLPAGVKFDPTDQELIEHLEAKVELGKESKSHPLIDEFIPTIEGEDGICYTHPEKLPGVTRDGLSRHFFHRPSKAYTTGTRKRRKIQMEYCDTLQGGGGGETRWHKTGKTRPVTVNGKQKGYKKIMVLYTYFGKKRKPEKTNWIMHQYHLGQHEEEKEGELVVSKIFYQTQPRQCNWSFTSSERNNSTDPNCRIRDSGSTGSCSSRKVIPQTQTDEISLNIHPFKADQFSFNLPFRKTFDQLQAAANNAGEASIAREVQDTCEVREMGQHHVTHELPHHQINATAAAFHISSSSRATHSISTIISQPAAPLLHHTPIHILDEDRSLHVPRIMLPNIENFQQQEEQYDKVGGIRSAASGLEELIMGCTSTTDHIKQEYSSITNPQEAEWFKYSTFWADPDNPDYHGL